MGARVSIQFINGKDKSVILFSHWGGMEFVRSAELYLKELKLEAKRNNGNFVSYPLGRLEPSTVIVDFIRDLTKDGERVESDLYLGATKNDGDNSDYGHHKIDLTK